MPVSKSMLPWRRFWCPLGSRINCDGDDTGFLIDPSDKFGRYVNPGLHPLADLLSESGALALCGEPGIGKSTELEALRVAIEAGKASGAGDLCWLSLQEIADFTDFRKHSVESAAWQQWRQGSGRLTLVVDGVDEGPSPVARFVNRLRGLLKDEPTERLRLLLACRTWEWPLACGGELFGLWPGDPGKRVYELCPLRRADVMVAAESRGFKASAFLQAVFDRHVVPLATRPITLFFLLDEFAQNSTLPQSHRELYRRATERLSREVNEQRLEMLRSLHHASSAVTNADRLRAAQRLACLALLSGATGIRAATTLGAAADDTDLLAEVASDAGANGVGVQAVNEVLETALFTSLGPNRFGFIHRTIAEYLAAEHLSELSLVQLRRLLCQRDQNGEHVIPQLAELAAWVAGSNRSFGEYVLKIEPEVLLRSDVIQHDGEFKSRLVDAVLREVREERAFDGNHFNRFLSGLSHPELEGQLSPIISNPQGHFVERRVAMRIAGECRCAGLADCLLARIQDANDNIILREKAADALAALVPDDRISMLEPLARGEVQPDPDDSIKAAALHRLVPRFWKVRDSLPHLTNRKEPNSFLSYWAFIDYVLPDSLEDEDIIPVLEWLRPRKNCFDFRSTFHRFASIAFARALKRLHEPVVAEVVVSLWQQWSQGDFYHLPHKSEFVSALEGDKCLRENLAALYLNDPATDTKRCLAVFYPVQLLSEEAVSLDWLLDQIVIVPLSRRDTWAATIGHLANRAQIAVVCWDKLLQRIGEVPELANHMAWLMRVLNLDEPDARKAKADYIREQRRIAQRAKFSSQTQSVGITGAIHEAFERFERGDGQAWLQLWLQLVSSESGNCTHYSNSDLATCPHWALLTAEQQAGVARIARAYLLSPAHQSQPLDERSDAFWPTRCALCMLRETFTDDQPLREVVLDSWLGAVVSNIGLQADAQRDLFRRLYILAPEKILAFLADKARSEASTSHDPFILNVAADAWDRCLSDLAISVIRDSTDRFYALNALNELAGRDLTPR